MSILPKAAASSPKPRRKAKGDEKVVFNGTVEPLPGWTVAYTIVSKADQRTANNPEGHFVRLTDGVGWQADRAITTAMIYSAVVDDLRKRNA